MNTYKIGLLNGDGIGPEIIRSCKAVLDTAQKVFPDVHLDFAFYPMGWEAIETHGVPMPQSTVEALRKCDGWIMGPHDNRSYPIQISGVRNPSGELRHTFELYANIRPARCVRGVPALSTNMDLVVVRENTEGFYPDRNMFAGSGESMPTKDVVLSTGVFTRKAAERIARTAFELAIKRRKHITIVHKVNAIRLAYGMFIEAIHDVGGQYPEVRIDDYHVDSMAAHLVKRSADFDVIVTTNMFGDILSDLTAALSGSLGVAPSLNVGDHFAMAQATHGSAPDIAGQGIANPTGMILSAAMLIAWLGNRKNDPSLTWTATSIQAAVDEALMGGVLTRDLGGVATTVQFSNVVQEKLLQMSR